MVTVTGDRLDFAELIDPEGQLHLAARVRADEFDLEHATKGGAGIGRSGGGGGAGPACAPASLGAVIPSDEEILRAIVALGDDGFVPRHQLVARFRGQGERDMRRAIGRSAGRGLLLERKDPEGRSFVAVSTEGWQALRSGEFEPRRLRNRED